MRHRVGTKIGDTLIEVALAVGIFSMVAIAIVTVMNRTSSSAQTALETTLAREEIDAQAEALRFIHASYISNRGNENNEYVKTWNGITGNAITDADSSVITYAPTSCADLYNAGNINRQKSFIINTRNLSTIYNAANSSQFTQASTYPRLIYQGDTNALINSGSSPNFRRAEGIFIVAVKDPNTTDIVTPTGTIGQSAYFDFYIRTCWYGAGSDTPSTISTVIRLYDPNVQQGNIPGQVEVTTYPKRDQYDNSSSTAISSKVVLSKPKHNENWVFYGWCDGVVTREDDMDSCSGNVYQSGDAFTNPDRSQPLQVSLQAMWGLPRYTVNFNSNGSSWTKDPLNCKYTDSDDVGCVLLGSNPTSDDYNGPTRSGFIIVGWCKKAIGNNDACPNSDKIPIASTAKLLPELREKLPSGGAISLYAIWESRNETITIRTSWTSSADYDSYLKLQRPDSNSFESANYSTTNLNVTFNGQTYSLITGHGDGRGSHNSKYYEQFTINTLGGKNYYYSIYNWDNPGNIGGDITITVSGPYLGAKTFKSTSRSNCKYWNVFAYKDGKIVNRNTCSSSMEYGY